MDEFETFLAENSSYIQNTNNHYLKVNKSISHRNQKIRVTILDIQPLTPAIGGGRVRLLGLYGNFDPNIFDVTYIGSYDWPGETKRITQVTESLREIIIPLSTLHFDQYNNINKTIKAPCFDVTFSELAHLSPDFINECVKNTKIADVIIFSHPWLFSVIYQNVELDNKFVIYDAHNHEGLLRFHIYYDKSKTRTKLCSNIIKSEFECCTNSDLILTCSKEDSANFHKYYGIDQNSIETIPNGVFINENTPRPDRIFKSRLKHKLGFKNSLCCFIGSNYKPNTEAVNLIISAANLDKSISYVILGSVCDSYNNSKLPSNVNMVGVVTDEHKHIYFNASDIAINPMLSGSGTNIKMFDYMSAALPIVTTTIGARGIDNKLGNIYEICANSPGGLVNTIHKVLNNKARMNSLSFFARKEAETKYNFNRISFELGCLLKKYILNPSNTDIYLFSVIVPTYNRHQNLFNLLSKLDKQTFKDFEIIIIDQSDTTLSATDMSCKNINYIHTNIKGATKARNTGAKLANGKILAFIDDDCLPDDNWLNNAKKYFMNPKIVGIEGRVFPDITGSEFRVISNSGVEGLAFLTANLFARKDKFIELQGFDELFDNPHFREDTDFGWRLQELGEVPFAEDVCVVHPSHLRTSLRESAYERNKFYIQDPLLMQKHSTKFVKLIKKERHYNDKHYWQYFRFGMEKYNIPDILLIKTLKLANIDNKYIPNWVGGSFYIEPVADHKDVITKPVIHGFYHPNLCLSLRLKICFYSILKLLTTGSYRVRYTNKLNKAKTILRIKKSEHIILVQ